jgi:GAF domain-containing protein
MARTEKDYYHSLHRVAAILNSTSSPKAILEFIVENIAKTLEVKGCSIMLLNPELTIIMHSATWGLSDGYVRKGPVSTDKSISEALVGKPVAVENAAVDERIQYRIQAQKEGIASILSVPIALKDEIIGVIRVYTSEPVQFTAEDIFFVSAVSNLGAIALEKLQLYKALQTDYETFKSERLDWRAALGYESTIEETSGLWGGEEVLENDDTV